MLFYSVLNDPFCSNLQRCFDWPKTALYNYVPFKSFHNLFICFLSPKLGLLLNLLAPTPLFSRVLASRDVNTRVCFLFWYLSISSCFGFDCLLRCMDCPYHALFCLVFSYFSPLPLKFVSFYFEYILFYYN